ncbi:MAG: hypothetical protein R3C11_13470 [Planctomycetaceae bacterium]
MRRSTQFCDRGPLPTTGLLTAWDPPPLGKDQQVILPANMTLYGAKSVEWGRLYQSTLALIEAFMTQFNPQDLEEYQQVVAALPEIIGFDPQTEFSIAWISVRIFVWRRNQGLRFTLGWIRQKVKDEEKLKVLSTCCLSVLFRCWRNRTELSLYDGQ